VKALTTIDDFNEVFNSNFSDDEFETIGGLVIHHFGHLPLREETVVIDGYQFTVLNADNRRIHLLRLRPPEKD
jgi:magnesium and cobalt transporter